MATARICDLCGQQITSIFRQLKVLDAHVAIPPRKYKTIGSLDLHDTCYQDMQFWVHEAQQKMEP